MITETLLECEMKLSHSKTMSIDQTNSVFNAALGQPALQRGPVDLLMEAERLKFSAEELTELKRLYAGNTFPGADKKPQKQT